MQLANKGDNGEYKQWNCLVFIAPQLSNLVVDSVDGGRVETLVFSENKKTKKNGVI